MKKVITLITASLFLIPVYAQETVSWASEIIDVSSEFSPYEYSAIQALHRPNVLPMGGDSPNAWRPKKTDKEDFIVVEFSNPIVAQQVAIAESENPGAIKEVYAYDADYEEYKLFDLTPRALPIDSRMLNLFFEKTAYPIQAIKIVLDGSASPGYNAIDAVGISASNIPITVLINLAAGVNMDAEAQRLSANVNSAYSENSPILSPDGKRMYFSRQYHPGNVGGEDDAEDIWVSEWNEEKQEWNIAQNAGAPLNTKGPNFVSSISNVDGKEILILGNRYGKKGRMYTGVSMSQREGNTYTAPTDVLIEDEYNYSPNADYFLVPTGDAMLLSAERDDSYGKRDLYVTFKKPDGSWTAPKNLGGDINTTGEEKSPFLAEDNETLYFASDGYSGYGGMDVFVSKRKDDSWSNWGVPGNMGTSVNTAGDDNYFSIPSTGQQLYFTRGEKGEDTDIYTLGINELFMDEAAPIVSSVAHLGPISEAGPAYVLVEGKVIDKKTSKVVNQANIRVDLENGETIETAKSADGTFHFRLEVGRKYMFVAASDGFSSGDEQVDLTADSQADTIAINVSIEPIEEAKPVAETIIIRDITFSFNKSELTAESMPYLIEAVAVLKKDPDTGAEVIGHTDDTGPSNYNLILSQRRAQSVIDYLIENGIAEDRLVLSFVGEDQPATSNDARKSRSKNRRVEIKIVPLVD